MVLIRVKTKLGFLHPFWNIEAYYPLRNQVSYQVSLKDSRQILLIDADETTKYKIEVTDLKMRVFYAEFVPQIRNKYVKKK